VYNTQDNLKAALAGESQASRKYQYFAEKAEKEGQPQVARLFRAASEAETVHARNHLNALNGIGTTKENLQSAIQGEHYEFTQMYPPFVDQAAQEKSARAEKSFRMANEVEKIHHSLYQQALAAMEAGGRLAEGSYHVCPICGNTVFGQAPEVCQICGAPGSSWKRIE
jgi:rubrerythrin